MPADVKANIKQQGIKDLVTYLRNFYTKYLQNLRYNAKTGCNFHWILVAIPSTLMLSVKNSGMGGSLTQCCK